MSGEAQNSAYPTEKIAGVDSGADVSVGQETKLHLSML